jgi:DNA-binding NarL/FixJ family response regulator
MEQAQETMAARQVRIVVTEDDDPVRRRFVSLLSGWDGCTLVADCATLAATERVIRSHQIDLLITDCKLPDGSGIDAIALLRSLQPQAEAMVISVLADEATVLDAVRSGATGYLLKDAGSIDLIGRTPTGLPGAHRYWLADYKSNQLGAGCEYRQADLAEAMVHHEYALQATLYLVALHRYLRWRVPGYQIRDHLGGAAYLFVRGMDPTRPAAATRGVFWWQPAAAAIEALDHLFAHGAPR